MIRKATLRDIPAMVGLGREFHQWAAPPWEWDAPTVERTCATCVASDERCAFVAERDGEVIGGLLGVVAASMLHGGLEAHEAALFVAPDARGCGPLLVRRFVRWGKERGAVRIVVQAWHGEAGALFAALGFARVSETWIR